jgi:hypothetical protein
MLARVFLKVSNQRMAENFGCEHCWPPDADAAWQARNALHTEHELVDESHFHVMIQACRHCSQRFVSIFTETVDWVDGDDPQYWTLLPVTAAEVAKLVQQGDSVTETELSALGAGRRLLRHDHPKGGPARSYWG